MRDRQPASPCNESFTRAAAWLADLAEADDPSHARLALGDQFRLLYGLWICERAVGSSAPSPASVEMARQVEALLRAESRAGTFDPLRYDATLLLLVARILHQQGRQTPGIDEFACQIASALMELPCIPLRFVSEACLLAALGYDIRPPVPTLTPDEIEGDALALFDADKEQLRAIGGSIAAATHFGRKPPRAVPGLLATLRVVLPPILLETLRRGDIDTGALLLRTLRYLRLTRTRAVRDAAIFLAGQQQRDGKFGYFTARATATAEAMEHGREADLDVGLHLPLTVSCLWSLAETTVPGFSLINQPRRPARGGAARSRGQHGQ